MKRVPLEASPSVLAADLILDALAVWRLTRLITFDLLTQGLRDKVRTYEARPERDVITDSRRFGEQVGTVGPLTTLVNCPWCASVWVAAGVALLRRVAPLPWRATARTLAVSVVAGALDART